MPRKGRVVGSAVEFELELGTCNWQRSEVRSSAHKKSIKSQASASSPLASLPVAIAAAFSLVSVPLCLCPRVHLCAALSARARVHESVGQRF